MVRTPFRELVFVSEQGRYQAGIRYPAAMPRAAAMQMLRMGCTFLKASTTDNTQITRDT